MITVAILINGNPVMARSATRIKDASPLSKLAHYKVDDGSIIKHDPDKGAIPLAIALLKTIKESK